MPTQDAQDAQDTQDAMHDGERRTDARLVRALLREQFPAWADRPIEPVASAGTDNALYRIGDDLVARLPRIDWAADDAPREHAWLPRLAPSLPCPIAAPIALGRPGEGYPWSWSVCRWLDGDHPDPDRLDGHVDGHGLARDLAGFVDALHAIPADGGPPAKRGVPLALRDGPTLAALDELAVIDQRPGGDREGLDLDALRDAWSTDRDAPAHDGPPAWLHADLSPGNVLVDAKGRLVGVLDFGCFGTGDPAIDLLPAWNLLSHATRPTYREQLGVDAATWARGRGWALSVALIQLPYYRTRNPRLAASARRVVAAVLADHAR